MVESKVLAVQGYRNEPVPNRYFRQSDPAKHLVIFFPGFNYHCDMPLFFYLRSLFLERGADVFQIEYVYHLIPGFEQLPEAERNIWVGSDISAACNVILSQRSYERITLVGKSLGTLAMAYLFASDNRFAKAEAVWLTPLVKNEKLRMRIKQTKPKSLFIAGGVDEHNDLALLDELREATNGEVMFLPGLNHHLEVEGSLWGSLEKLEQILQKVEEWF